MADLVKATKPPKKKDEKTTLNPFEPKDCAPTPLRNFFLKRISVQEKSRKAVVTEGEKIEEEKRPWMFPVSSGRSIIPVEKFPLGARFSFRVFDKYCRAAFYEDSGNIAAGFYRMRVQKKHKPL